MMDNGLSAIENYFLQLKEWMLQFITITNVPFYVFVLMFIFFRLFIEVVLVMLEKPFPIVRVIRRSMEYLFLPGSLMKSVWRVFTLKRLNITTAQTVSFSWGWIRYGIKVEQPFKSTRQAFFFFYSPFLNIPVIIGWVLLATPLFQWLDLITNFNMGKFPLQPFNALWLYVLISLILTGLPDIPELFGPLQITVVKTPEFYIFLIYLIFISYPTIIFWGYGIPSLFALIYSIFAVYEVEKISRLETKRLAKEFDKMFTRTKSEPLYLIDPPD